jgi:hypothetical protein
LKSFFHGGFFSGKCLDVFQPLRRQLAQKDNPNYLAEQVAKYEVKEQKWKRTPTQEVKDIFTGLRSKLEKITSSSKKTQ